MGQVLRVSVRFVVLTLHVAGDAASGWDGDPVLRRPRTNYLGVALGPGGTRRRRGRPAPATTARLLLGHRMANARCARTALGGHGRHRRPAPSSQRSLSEHESRPGCVLLVTLERSQRRSRRPAGPTQARCRSSVRPQPRLTLGSPHCRQPRSSTGPARAPIGSASGRCRGRSPPLRRCPTSWKDNLPRRTQSAGAARW